MFKGFYSNTGSLSSKVFLENTFSITFAYDGSLLWDY